MSKRYFSWNKIRCSWELRVNEGIRYRAISMKNIFSLIGRQLEKS